MGLLLLLTSQVYFECAPVSHVGQANTIFEFVVIGSDSLANRRPDVESFSKHFERGCRGNGSGGNDIISFKNIGKDATLIVPCPLTQKDEGLQHMTHLKSFLQSSTPERIHRFWAKIGGTFLEELRAEPDRRLWLSTAGDGVAWLHVRLDKIPKYYHYHPYRDGRNK